MNLINKPLCDFISIGEIYTFRIRKKTVKDFAIHNNKDFVSFEKWKAEGDTVYSIDYVINESNSLDLGIQSESDNVWHNLIEYQVK